MESSEKIDLLATALAGAQAVILPAPKDAVNPHFKNRYADLAAVWEACRAPLADQKLAVVQAPEPTGDGHLGLRTTLMHASGQWVSSVTPLIFDGKSMQSLGSAITYARRYALCAMVGIVADVDDDGQSAGSRGPARQASAPAPARAGRDTARTEPTGDRSREKVTLPGDRIGARGLDVRPWVDLIEQTVGNANRALAKVRAGHNLDQRDATSGIEVTRHLVKWAVSQGCENPEPPDSGGKPKRVNIGKLAGYLHGLYIGGDGWRDALRKELRKYVASKYKAAIQVAENEAHGDDPPDNESESQEPGTASEDEAQLEPALAEGDEGWGEGRE